MMMFSLPLKGAVIVDNIVELDILHKAEALGFLLTPSGDFGGFLLHRAANASPSTGITADGIALPPSV